MIEPKSRLRVDYKPSGEPYIHALRPRVRGRYWLLLAAALAGAAVFPLLQMSAASAGRRALPAEEVSATASPPQPVPPAAASSAGSTAASAVPAAQTLLLEIHRGDSLAGLFAAHGLSAADLQAMLALGGRAAASLRRVQPGETISVRHDGAGRVLGLTLPLSAARTLNISRGADGYRVQTVDIPTEYTTAYAHGVIDSSLFDAATRAGLDDAVTMELIHLFGWDIDFAHDIQSGDSFTVLYQQIHRRGQPVTDGPILAAEFVTGGRRYRVVRFTAPNGRSGYYTPDGRNVRKTLLRAPVSYSRISSGFSRHRLNPVLGYTRAHRGVDYAAPIGTPIKAAGDGRIVYRGWKGGYGNCIIIRHGGGYSTLYAHLSHFRRGLHLGSHVRQDQVIGYVGMTGLATGPHLHYEVHVNGVARNPRSVKLPSAAPIAPAYREAFERDTATLLAELSNGGELRVATRATGDTSGTRTTR